jgi:hypothetical protein
MSTLRNKIFHHLVQNHTLTKTAGMGPLATLVMNRIKALEKGTKSKTLLQPF